MTLLLEIVTVMNELLGLFDTFWATWIEPFVGWFGWLGG